MRPAVGATVWRRKSQLKPSRAESSESTAGTGHCHKARLCHARSYGQPQTEGAARRGARFPILGRFPIHGRRRGEEPASGKARCPKALGRVEWPMAAAGRSLPILPPYQARERLGEDTTLSPMDRSRPSPGAGRLEATAGAARYRPMRQMETNLGTASASGAEGHMGTRPPRAGMLGEPPSPHQAIQSCRRCQSHRDGSMATARVGRQARDRAPQKQRRQESQARAR